MKNIQLRNTEQSYGWVAIIIHWFMAAIIFSLFGLGLYMVELGYYDSWYRDALFLHKSIGVLIFLMLVFRIIWCLLNVKPLGEIAINTRDRLEKAAAHYAHVGLYLLMLVLMFSGYLISTADGRGIDVFELFTVPALPFSVENQEDIAGDIHWFLAWSLMVLVSVHLFAAFKHHFINKDQTLKNMLSPKRKNTV